MQDRKTLPWAHLIGSQGCHVVTTKWLLSKIDCNVTLCYWVLSQSLFIKFRHSLVKCFFLKNFSFFVVSQFALLSFVTICVFKLSNKLNFGFCHNSSLKILRHHWESTEKVIWKYWESTEKLLTNYWESNEKVMRK